MNISLKKPNPLQIQTFLDAQSRELLSYAQVGATQQVAPAGYKVDHNRIHLGFGAETFAAAKAALQQWTMFNLGWVEICWPSAPIQVGTTVGMVATAFGLWTLNACQIVYIVDESDRNSERFGFAYGTLPGHLEKGEERFLIEWNRTEDSVWYDILAFSRPNHLLAKVGYPVVRHFQKRFARDSKTMMVQACADCASAEAAIERATIGAG